MTPDLVRGKPADADPSTRGPQQTARVSNLLGTEVYDGRILGNNPSVRLPHWRERLFKLLDRLNADELRRMGFAEGWEECPLWKAHLVTPEKVGSN